jgi:hypothetical protein
VHFDDDDKTAQHIAVAAIAANNVHSLMNLLQSTFPIPFKD